MLDTFNRKIVKSENVARLNIKAQNNTTKMFLRVFEEALETFANPQIFGK